MADLLDTIEIFCCYAHKDRELQDQLVKHLEPLRRAGQVTTWYDRELLPGTDWKQEIDKHLSTADVVLLLISPNFMNSDYCYSIEMQKALERHKRGETSVIPVILRPVSWQETPIGELQALPTDGKPIVRWSDRDEAFRDVVRGIMTVVSSLRNNREMAFLSLNAQKAQVTVEMNGEFVGTYPLNKRRISIGRSPHADIFVKSPYFTMTHAFIRWTDGAWVITDTGSPHGLYSNGQRIHQHKFADDDRVAVGDVIIHFLLVPQR